MKANWRDRTIPAEMTFWMVTRSSILALISCPIQCLVRECDDQMVLIMKSYWLVNQAILPDIDSDPIG